MHVDDRLQALQEHQNRKVGFTSRQTNLMLEVLMILLIVSGIVSWLLPLDRAWIATTAHGIAGFMLLAVVPFKFVGPVKAGFRRGRATRWLSTAFGMMVLTGVGLGLVHSTTIWWGVGYWTAMWTHLLLGFASVPLLVWHVASRPVRPGRVDVDRRALLTSSAVLAVGAGAWVAQKVVHRSIGGNASNQGGTGSHELASFDPDKMPRMQWINDTAPTIDNQDWILRIEGQEFPLTELAAMATPLTAWLDCTDGWRSEQRWDVIPLSDVLSDVPSRSIEVISATGYNRLFARSAAGDVYLCVGYDGKPLHRGHGAPVRIVAPNRRGPWWIKWVTEVELSDRPAWSQLPLPAT